MAFPFAAMFIDIICLMCVALGGSMALATGVGIALFNETNIPEGSRRLDGLETGGILTFVARLVEGWPKANSQSKAILVGRLTLCLIAGIAWICS